MTEPGRTPSTRAGRRLSSSTRSCASGSRCSSTTSSRTPRLTSTCPAIASRRNRTIPMDLTKTRIVTDNVGRLALFYAALIGVDVVLNDYYVEVPTPPAAVAFSRRRYTEPDAFGAYGMPSPNDTVILDFQVDDVD